MKEYRLYFYVPLQKNVREEEWQFWLSVTPWWYLLLLQVLCMRVHGWCDGSCNELSWHASNNGISWRCGLVAIQMDLSSHIEFSDCRSRVPKHPKRQTKMTSKCPSSKELDRLVLGWIFQLYLSMAIECSNIPTSFFFSSHRGHSRLGQSSKRLIVDQLAAVPHLGTFPACSIWCQTRGILLKPAWVAVPPAQLAWWRDSSQSSSQPKGRELQLVHLNLWQNLLFAPTWKVLVSIGGTEMSESRTTPVSDPWLQGLTSMIVW